MNDFDQIMANANNNTTKSNKSFDKNNTLIEVSPHIRNLHEGWSASTNKIETALEHGFCLKEGQTWVDSYEKEYSVA